MKLKYFILLMTAMSLVWGCKTTEKSENIPKPVKTEKQQVVQTQDVEVISITPDEQGFAPGADAPRNVLNFQIKYISKVAVKNWKVEFLNEKQVIVRTLLNSNKPLPSTISWDGKNDKSILEFDGNYTAQLVLDQENISAPLIVKSSTFLLDITPPSGSIVVQPKPFVPNVEDPQVKFDITIKDGAAKAINWRLFVIDPQGQNFTDFISENFKTNTIVWNGRAENNGMLLSGATYTLKAQIFDSYGNRGYVSVQFPIAVYSIKSGSVETISLSDIHFKAFTADYKDVPVELAAENESVLKQLAALLKSDTSRKIKIIGYANKVFWNDEEKGNLEQKNVLIPLSQSRAEAIKSALMKQGISAELFDLSALGAENPVVPFSDSINNWKNRRVEFILFDSKTK